MADTKISAMPAVTTIAGSDILPVVTTPGTTPTNNQITGTNLIHNLLTLSPATSRTDLHVNNDHPGMTTGQYYGPFWEIQTNSAATVVANTLYLVLICIPNDITVLSLGTGVGTGAAGNVNMGIYTNVNGMPNSLVANSSTGAVSTAASGNKITSLNGGSGVLLTAGWYWLGLICDSAISMNMMGLQRNTSLPLSSSNPIINNPFTGYTASPGSFTLPSTVGTLTGISGITGVSMPAMLIGT